MKAEQWQRVEEIFGAALDIAPDERAAFLMNECGSDEQLRREVEALLASHHRAGDFIQAPVFEDALNLIQSAEPSLERGHRIGPYEIIREIGRGGMGAVYFATRADDEYKKRVAIKLIKRGMDTDDILRRFRNERQILASLNHPNIARLFDGGTTSDGLPYFVMEYIEGLPLLAYCEERQLATSERLALFRTICSAVGHAHQNLVVHRDLKPGNILITHEGEPKLLDFGVAKFLNPELMGDGLTQTQTRFRVLTPEYASPEQVRGGHITTASDIYSLGVILYELLTGQRPYKLKDSSPEEMMRVICDSEPSKPSNAATRGRADTEKKNLFGKNVPASPHHLVAASQLRGDLDNIVLMALRKEPGRRYKSVEQFSEDIERHLTGRPVIARKDTFAYRASKFIARNRGGVAAAAIVLLAVFAGLAVSLWQARVAAKERDEARQERAKAEDLNKFLQSILSAASPEEKGKDATVIEVLNDAAGRIAAEFAGQPELKAQALLTIGRTYSQLGLLRESELKLREALKLNSELYGEENKATTSSMIYLAEVLLDEAKFDEAEKLLSKGVEIERKLSPSGSKELAYGLFVFGELRVRRGENEKAQPLLQEAVAMYNRISGENNEDTAHALISLGRAKERLGDLAGAEAVYRQSISIFRGLPQRYEGRLATALLNLGSLLVTKENYDEAINAIGEADGIYQKLGPGQANFYTFYGKFYLSRAYMYNGDYEKTAGEARKAIDIARKIDLAETPDFLYPLNYLALSLTRTGRAREGEPYLRESLQLGRRILPKEDYRLLATESSLAECLTAQNRFAEAEPLIVSSYEGLKTTQGEKHPYTITAIKRAVELYEKWNKPDLAAQYRALLPN